MNVLDAFNKTVHGFPGGAEVLAVRLGMSATILRNKANINHAANKPTLEEADRIMAITGDLSMLHALAHSHGHMCVKLEQDATASDMAILELVTKFWGAQGEVGSEIHKALDDGRIDETEVERIERAMYNTHRALAEILARVKGMAQA